MNFTKQEACQVPCHTVSLCLAYLLLGNKRQNNGDLNQFGVVWGFEMFLTGIKYGDSSRIWLVFIKQEACQVPCPTGTPCLAYLLLGDNHQNNGDLNQFGVVWGFEMFTTGIKYGDSSRIWFVFIKQEACQVPCYSVAPCLAYLLLGNKSQNNGDLNQFEVVWGFEMFTTGIKYGDSSRIWFVFIKQEVAPSLAYSLFSSTSIFLVIRKFSKT